MARDLTPQWALDAYNRLLDARRHVSDVELEEMERDTKRQQERAKIMRRLEKVA